MESTLTVSALAEAVARSDRAWDDVPATERERERDLLVRRIRHWTLAGALPTAGTLHAGTGRHRRYPAEAAYLVAVLHRLADWGLPIGVLKSISEYLREWTSGSAPKLNTWSELWFLAVSGRSQVFLHFIPWHATDRPDKGLVALLLDRTGVAERLKQVPEGAYLDLTALFRGIKV